MLEIYFNYFVQIVIPIIIITLAIGFSYSNKKFRLIGLIFIFLIITFVGITLSISPSLKKLKDSYYKFQQLNEMDISKVLIFQNEYRLINNQYDREIISKPEIHLFLSKLTLKKGLLFKDIESANGYPDYFAEVYSLNESLYFFEFITDINGTKTVNFYLDKNKNGLKNLIGKYYLE